MASHAVAGSDRQCSMLGNSEVFPIIDLNRGLSCEHTHRLLGAWGWVWSGVCCLVNVCWLLQGLRAVVCVHICCCFGSLSPIRLA